MSIVIVSSKFYLHVHGVVEFVLVEFYLGLCLKVAWGTSGCCSVWNNSLTITYSPSTIHQCSHPSINPSITHLSSRLYIYPSTCLTINASVGSSIHPFIHPSTHPMHVFCCLQYPSICLSVHLSDDPSYTTCTEEANSFDSVVGRLWKAPLSTTMTTTLV